VTSDCHECGYLEEIIDLLVGDVVIHKDGLIVLSKILILFDFLKDFWQFLEFAYLCGFEGLGFERADVVDLRQFAIKELQFVEDDFKDRVTVFFLLEDYPDLLLLRQFYYSYEAYLTWYKEQKSLAS
jgi:hypothetical protein